MYRELFERARSRDDGTAVLAPAEAVSRGRGHGGGVSAGGRRGESVGLVGERLSVGCQRASQSLRAAQAPANHLPSPPPTLRPPSALQPRCFVSFSHRFAVHARVSPLLPPIALGPHASPPPLSVAFSTARSSPSFPSVASSPRCSVLQARYNAARRRPSCIFKRAVLLCSRYHPHHLRRPTDDRSPPSPIHYPPPPPPPPSPLDGILLSARFAASSLCAGPVARSPFVAPLLENLRGLRGILFEGTV